MSTTTVDPAAGRQRAARWWPLALLILAIAVYAPTAVWLWDRWTISVWQHAHGLFIPPLVAYFCWTELRGMHEGDQDSSGWGFAFLVPALALHILDTGMGTQLLSAMSIVIAAPGLSLLLLGGRRTKAIAFPLALLAFMLPIPLAFTARLHLALRHVATSATAPLLSLIGIPVLADGTYLHLRNGTLQVADACSGFSTLYAAIAFGFLVAHSMRSWTRRFLVLAMVVPIAVAANIARLILLGLLCHFLGFEILGTWMHTASGVLTFVLALPLIFWLGRPWDHRVAKGDAA